MTYNKFIEEYTSKGLLKKQKKDFKTLERLIHRAYKEIKIAVESAEVIDRKIIAEHLIHKDPNRYSWAERYIEQ